MPEIGLSPASEMGHVVVGVGLAIHLALAPRGRISALEEQVAEMRRVILELDRDLSDIQQSSEILHDRLDDMPDAEKITGELSVLHGLLKQFAVKKNAAVAGNAIPKQASAPKKKKAESTAAAVPALPETALDMSDAEIIEAVERGLRDEKVELFLQPIVTLPQRRRTFYECFSRIYTDDGRVITPEQYIPIARRVGLVEAIDNLLLVHCVQLVRRARRDHVDVGFICNISNESLRDADFFEDFVGFMEENRELAQSLIFEFDQESVMTDDYITRMHLERLHRLGYRLSMDQVTDLDLDLDDLAEQGFKIVKINAHLLHEVARGEDPLLDMKAFKGALDRHAMDLVVEKIESDDMLKDLLDLRIDFGQGYLFGEPRPLGARR